MSFTIRVSQDTVTPDLRRKMGVCANPVRIWRALGTEVVSITQRSFRDASLRIAPWAPKKRGGGASNLILKGMLLSSIRIVGVDRGSVSVGTDRVYGAVHQLGSRSSKGRGGGIPARPFFPFGRDGVLAGKHVERVRAVLVAEVGRQMG